MEHLYWFKSCLLSVISKLFVSEILIRMSRIGQVVGVSYYGNGWKCVGNVGNWWEMVGKVWKMREIG